jgi:methyl-accepting chemotaxis protein
MLRWLNNRSLRTKAFSGPVLLLAFLVLVSLQMYVLLSNVSDGLGRMTESDLPKRARIERLAHGAADAHVKLFRYSSWLNSGVDSTHLTELETALGEVVPQTLKMLAALMDRPDLDDGERARLVKIQSKLARYGALVKDVCAMGQIQASMAVMMLGEADTLSMELQADIDALLSDITARSESIARELSDGATANKHIILIGLLVALSLSIPLTLLVVLSIARPIVAVTRGMTELSHGNLDVEFGYKDRLDEVGRMVGAICVFQQNARDVKAFEQLQQDEGERAAAARKTEMEMLAAEFENSVKAIAGRLKISATCMSGSSESLTEASGAAFGAASTALRVVGEASQSVGSVAVAAEELSATIRELSQQISYSTGMISATADQTEQATREITTLSQEIGKISSILDLIQTIAKKTNLLALNATIEAARAGEYGKGFAVVAGEVKHLASQTTDSTKEIESRINEIRETCSQVVETIDTVSTSMADVRSVSITMAAAIEQQSAATQEIAKNAVAAQSQVGMVVDQIEHVIEVTHATDQASKTVQSETTNVLSDAETVNQKVDFFLLKVR